MKRQKFSFFIYGPAFRKFITGIYKQSQSSGIQSADSKKDKSLSRKSDIKWTDIGMFWATAVLTIGTLLLFWEATHQTKQAKEALVEARTEFEIQRRPYIYTSTVQTDTLRIGRQEYAKISMKNFGISPALVIYATWKFSYDTIFDYPLHNFQYVNMFTAPEKVYTSVNTGDIITKSAYDSIMSGQLTMFAHGEVYYRDVIACKEYEYDYCYKIFPDGKFVASPNHNRIIEMKGDSEGFKPGYRAQLQREVDSMNAARPH